MPSLTGLSLAAPQRATRWLASGLFGQPWRSWAFALRIWIATLLALFIAFWLQLSNPSSSMITVAILALPNRGQAFGKAIYRVLATLIGATAALVFTAVFAQTRALFLVVFAAWMAMCVYMAALRDGNLAYAAVLSGYTVATLAVENIDAPLGVFDAATNSTAAIIVGVVATAVVNDVLAAPNVLDGLRPRLRAAVATASATVAAADSGPMPPIEALASQLAALTGMRLELATLASERTSGGRGAAAGRSAIAAILAALAGSRMLAVFVAAGPWQDTGAAAPSVDEIVAARLEADILESQALAEAELAAMEGGGAPMRRIALPIHSARQEAARKALRVFLLLLGGSLAFA
ncbi:FUSC family protein [Rhizosaccharibacter radicis]|uniref:FUSC family protein n=1 Tax=Rhizosaccharibacter radicis TaxID=2782605 RepID=A0ABT1W0P8_9PROT|nr:FUSC family protein [Acetobacteraceae bacterium KSS12]